MTTVNLTTQTFDVNDATVIVWHDGRDVDPDFGQYRQRYGYRIVADGWEYAGNDIRSGCGAAVDVADAARTLFSFLGACAESRAYCHRNNIVSIDTMDNATLFPKHVGQWAEANSDEISMLSIDPEEFDS